MKWKKRNQEGTHNVNKNNIFNHLPQNNVCGCVPYLLMPKWLVEFHFTFIIWPLTLFTDSLLVQLWFFYLVLIRISSSKSLFPLLIPSCMTWHALFLLETHTTVKWWLNQGNITSKLSISHYNISMGDSHTKHKTHNNKLFFHVISHLLRNVTPYNIYIYLYHYHNPFPPLSCTCY